MVMMFWPFFFSLACSAIFRQMQRLSASRIYTTGPNKAVIYRLAYAEDSEELTSIGLSTCMLTTQVDQAPKELQLPKLASSRRGQASCHSFHRDPTVLRSCHKPQPPLHCSTDGSAWVSWLQIYHSPAPPGSAHQVSQNFSMRVQVMQPGQTKAGVSAFGHGQQWTQQGRVEACSRGYRESIIIVKTIALWFLLSPEMEAQYLERFVNKSEETSECIVERISN